MAKMVLKDNADYRVIFMDGTSEVVKLYVQNDNYIGVPCLTDRKVGNTHIPYPYFKLRKAWHIEIV